MATPVAQPPLQQQQQQLPQPPPHLLESLRTLLQDRTYAAIYDSAARALPPYAVLWGADKQDRPQEGDCLVVYVSAEKFAKSLVLALVQFLEEARIPNCVVVHTDGITVGAAKWLKDEKKNLNFQFFSHDHVAHPLPQHYLVPLHRRITIEEARRYAPHTQPRSFPTISASQDAIIRWYGWREGDLIYVEKKYGNLQPYFTLELVVK